MKRRSFIKSILASAVAPMWLPSAGRVWVPSRAIVPPSILTFRGYDQNGKIVNETVKAWMDLLKRGTYPAGLGDIVRSVRY